MPPSHPPPHQAEKLKQLEEVLFGKKSAESYELSHFVKARLKQFHLDHQYESDDVLEKTYFIARRKIESELEEIIYIDRWLKKISFNIIRDFRKKENKHQRDIKKIIENGYCAETEYSKAREEQNIEPIKDKALSKTLEHLRPEQKDILTLRHIEGLDWKSIGNILDISDSTARKRGQRALQKLKTIFFSLYKASDFRDEEENHV